MAFEVCLGDLAHLQAQRVGELSWVGAVYPIERKPELVAKGISYFERYFTLSRFIL